MGKRKAPTPTPVGRPQIGRACRTCAVPEVATYIEESLRLTHTEGLPQPKCDTLCKRAHREFLDSGWDRDELPSVSSMRDHIRMRGCSEAWKLWDASAS